MNATEHRFTVGQRVEMTDEALKHFGWKKPVFGTIRAIGENGFVSITASDMFAGTYLAKRWQPASTEAIADTGRTCPTCGQRMP